MKNNYIFRGENLTELIQYRNIEVDKCIACNSSKFRNFSSSKDFPAAKCLNCGFIWMRPSFCKEGLDKYYSDYIGKRRINNKIKMDQRKEQYKLDVDFIQKYRAQGRMLDIGCSGGFFLDSFSKNIEKHGIEIDPSAVDYANQNFSGLAGRVNCISLEDYNPNSKFDLITMRGVIEHVMNPEKDIEKISSLLNKGGIFGVSATPNSEAICVDLYQDNWTLFHPIQHLWHFSPKTLSLICNRHGLELIASDFPYLGTPYEDVYEDIKLVADRIRNKENNIEDISISKAFYGNMMSLIFFKI